MFTVKPYKLVIFALLIGILAMRSQRDQARADLSDYRREVSQAATKAEAQARQTESALRAESETLRTTLAHELQTAKTTQASLVARIRSGTQRLSIAASCPADQAGADSSAASGSWSNPTRAELDPAAAEFLITLTAECDAAILERNACIKQYNTVRDLLTH